MTYKISEDIDVSLEGDALQIDSLMSSVIWRTADVIDTQEQLSREFRTLTRSILTTFFATHKSIRLLVAQRDTDFRMCADALSLAREQIEKVFLVALLLDDPETWINRYLKDDWKRMYRKYLHDKDWLEVIPRIKTFIDSNTVRFLEDFRKRAEVDDSQQEGVEFEFYNRGKKLPSHLQSSYISRFPVGQGAIKKIKDSQVRQFLERWYREYQDFSGYSHVLMDKISVVESAKNLRNEAKDRKNNYFLNIIVPSLMASWISTASACTELFRLVPTDIDLLGSLTKYWEELRRGSLLAKHVWKIRAKQIFPPTIGEQSSLPIDQN